MNTKVIGICGFSADEIEFVKRNLPQKDCEIMDTEEVTDIIAVSEFAVIINSTQMKEKNLEILFDYYSEIAPFSESVIMIGKVEMPVVLENKIVVYEDFEALKGNLKYMLLSAYRKQKKSENFSAKLANAITILSYIRIQPYITSAELSEKLELSQRSIQRYIETLRIAGEWIEYDTIHKGWRLQVGKSVLWGDFNDGGINR